MFAAEVPGVDVSLNITAAPGSLWSFIFKMGNWSQWNDVFDITLDGIPEVGKLIKIHSKWHFGADAYTEESITVCEENVRMCWDAKAIGVPRLFGDQGVAFYLPTPPVVSLRCIELTEIVTDVGSITNVRNFIEFDTFFGRFSLVFYRSRIEIGFTAFLDSLSTQVANL